MNRLKKSTSTMLITVMLLFNSQSLIIYADEEINNKSKLEPKQEQIKDNKIEKASDVKPPVLDISSLEVDKKEVKLGETVKISFKATDDISGIDTSWLQIHYRKPISGETAGTNLRYNEEKDVYEGYMKIENGMEEGLWKVYRVHLRDNQGNETNVYNSSGELDNANFTVFESNSDTKPPILDTSSLNVDKKSARPGDVAKISFKATDDISGIDTSWLQIHYRKPISGETAGTNLRYNEEKDVYEGYMKIENGMEEGLWKVYRVHLRDNQGNETNVYNSSGELDNANFTVFESNSDTKPPILDTSSLNVDKKSARPGDVVKISFKATDDISGIDTSWLQIHYRKPISGETAGTNLRYNEEKDVYEGYMKIENGMEEGLWKVYRVHLRDNQGNETNVYNSNGELDNASFTVLEDDNIINPPIVPTNRVPEISASDVEIKQDEEFKPLELATANDYEDGDLTKSIKVIKNTVDVNKPGEYEVRYEVVDSQGAKVTKTIKVVVKQKLVGMNRVPEISASDVEIKQGEGFNPLELVTANDHEDGDLTDKIEVIENTVDISNVGTYKVVYQVTDSQGASATKEIKIIVEKKAEELATGAVYQTHVEDYGWQEWKSNGEMSGTSGESKRLEGIKIKINDILPGAGITYRTHIQDYGWQEWKSNGEMSGTSGESKRLEGMEIKLQNAPGYSIEYRVHVQDYGWQEWKSNGEMAGTSGKSKRLEGIEIRIVKEKDPNLEYRTHIQDYGWQEWKSNGEMAGTSGKSKRLEGIEIKLADAPKGSNIKYQTHVEDYGWQEWKQNGEMSGTNGESKRLEGIRIKLENEPGYSIEYRVHVQDYGWQEWKSDGEMAGTSGQSKRLEGVEIRVIKR